MKIPTGIPPSRKIFATEDARNIASFRLPRLVYDFIEGAAGREIASIRNCQRFDELMLQSRVMSVSGKRSLETSFLGNTFGLPFGVAPMGMCDLAWPGADRYLGEMARLHDVPVCLSSAASSSIEQMRNWAEHNAWFQLYVGKSTDYSMQLVKRAANAGYETLVLTVDVPQVSRRTRDLRNGFSVPFSMGFKQFVDFALHPRWSLATLVNGVPGPANYAAGEDEKFDRHGNREGANWDFLEKLRLAWKGKLIVKGITSPTDAIRIRSMGIDAVYVSNHGGRQLDSAPPAIDLLPTIREAVGPTYPLIFDSGIRNGEDVVKALALGANFVMIGRPWLYALGAEGIVGLNALFTAFAGDISNVMAQLGANSTCQITGKAIYSCPTTHSNLTEPRQMVSNRQA
ncbi:MAG: alpha-hydroxy acid oxidase [Rhizobiaceae bacterium]